MKKLEDIPKKNPFSVPGDYFEQLPGVIQARVTGKREPWVWMLSRPASMRLIMATLVLAAAGVFWFTGGQRSSLGVINDELASISPDQLIEYLDVHDLATEEELVERIAWSPEDLKDLENTVYSDLDVSHQDIENALNEYDVEL